MIEPIAVYFEQCEPGWVVPESAARNHILLLMTEGTIVYRIGGSECLLTKGDALYMPKGAIRCGLNRSGAPHEMYVAHFQYAGDGEGLPVLLENRNIHTRIMQYDYVKQRFSLLTQHWLRKTKYADTFCHSILLEILAVVNEEADSVAKRDRAYSIVNQIQSYIAANYRRTIGMDELARLVERSPNYISRIFKEETGQTVTDYTQQLRITAACDLLANSQMNVREISDFLGFCEQSYFNKVFKRLTGTLPSAYMKEKVRRWKA